MQIGIAGLPYSGKSALFSTLLCHKSGSDSFKGKVESERGVVKVPDERLDRLTAMFNPKSKVNSTVEYLKVSGLESDQKSSHGLPPQFLANMKTVDAILLVVRSFENKMFPHPFDRIDPKADIVFANSEFLLADLTIIESRVERLEKQLRKIQNDADKKELDILVKCRAWLETEKPLREFAVSPDEEKILRGFQFLTAKPILYVINIGESQIPETESIIHQFDDLKSESATVTALCASIEKEIAELEPEDQAVFLKDMGIREPALFNLIHRSYELLGLISFFSVGEDECRAWTLRRGSNAQKAAGAIHTDLERGFIRAEVVAYEDLIANGNYAACRAKGLVRLEGKEYVVKDGDILEIRFNI
ncbi:MAG: redox-regulated ATPase YchF [Candidatus Marinimicrobia bacterium]|nr:redox-regulated ATPase YchF [Candidatus Neomarinimicrobiota bacterium]